MKKRRIRIQEAQKNADPDPDSQHWYLHCKTMYYWSLPFYIPYCFVLKGRIERNCKSFLCRSGLPGPQLLRAGRVRGGGVHLPQGVGGAALRGSRGGPVRLPAHLLGPPRHLRPASGTLQLQSRLHRRWLLQRWGRTDLLHVMTSVVEPEP